MKKIIIMLMLTLFLCGCGDKPQEYLVTAIGVDYDKALYTVSFEAVVVNTEAEGQQRVLLTGQGRTLIKAIDEVKKQTTQPLLLSHCGVVAVGKGISQQKLGGIMRYCKEEKDITLSIRFLKTENAAELLKTEPISSVSVGYDLMSLFDAQKQQNKDIKNRLFEIYEQLSPILPTIKTNETGYYFEKY